MQVALEWQLLPRPQKSVPVKNNKKDSCTHFVYDIKHISSAYNCSNLLQLQRHQINLYYEKGSSADSRCTIYLIFPPSCNLVHIQYFFLFLFLKSDILLKYSPWKTFQKFVQIKALRKVKSSAETTLAVCCTPDFPKVYWSESSLHADCMSHLYKQGAVCQLQDIMEENPEDRHQTDHTYRLIGLPRPKSCQLVLV